MSSLVGSVQVGRRPIAHLRDIIGDERYPRLVGDADQFRQRLAGRTIWNVSSTAAGGGVAEMLHVLIGYVEDLEIPIEWRVISGDAEFFAATKRLHNQIHGEVAGGPLSEGAAMHYARTLAANAVELLDQIEPGDLALPYRGRLGERGDQGSVGLPAAAPERRARLCVFPPRIRAVLDTRGEG